jgi:hypothetical protein
MEISLLYIGPGLGLGTIIIVSLVLLIIFASLIMIVWTPIRKFFNRIFRSSGKR